MIVQTNREVRLGTSLKTAPEGTKVKVISIRCGKRCGWKADVKYLDGCYAVPLDALVASDGKPLPKYRLQEQPSNKGAHYWHIRLIKNDIFHSHSGWIIKSKLQDMTQRLAEFLPLLDVDSDGEYAGYELTYDVLEFNQGNGFAELH